jgi:hypothetical protein
MLTFLLASSLHFLAAAEPQEYLIAPFPVTAQRVPTVIDGKLSASDNFAVGRRRIVRGQNCYRIQLKRGQSVMATLRSRNPGMFHVTFTDKVQKPIYDRYLQRVGDKVFLLNRNHEELDVQCVVFGRTDMTNEPYQLVLCEIDTDAALAKQP